jgi:hypothetical protein
MPGCRFFDLWIFHISFNQETLFRRRQSWQDAAFGELINERPKRDRVLQFQTEA